MDTGGRIRSYYLLRELARCHEVKLLSYYTGRKDNRYETEIQAEFPGAETVHIPRLDGGMLFQGLDYLGRFWRYAPFSVSKFTSSGIRRLLRLYLSSRKFDVSVCDFLAPSMNFPDRLLTPTILFQHNVESELWRRMASTENLFLRRLIYRIEAAKMARYEPQALAKFQHIVAVSDHDRQRMQALHPGCEITVVPTGVDTKKYSIAVHADLHPPRIVFTGSMDWEPNVDAVIYFRENIFPRIQQKLPAARFQIVGRNPPAPVKRLSSEFVEVTGTVPSVAEYLRKATVVVVPLRIGGGTRLKIFEAMAMGKAVVSTSIGAEGLGVKSGRDLILADEPSAFADAIVQLAQDDELRRQYEHAAAKLAAQYDWKEISVLFAEVLQRVCRSGQPQCAGVALSA